LNIRGVVLIALAALTACGGGGGGGESAVNTPIATPAATVPPVPVAPPAAVAPAPVMVVANTGTLQTSAGLNTYAAGSQELAIYNALNVIRLNAGAGVMTHAAQLDVASAAHAKYLLSNWLNNSAQGVSGHNQIPGAVDFYAVTPAERIAKAGFSAAGTTENITVWAGPLDASFCMEFLMTTIYHAAAMLGPYTNFGASLLMHPNPSQGTPNACVVKFGVGTGVGSSVVQTPAAGRMVTYPYSGQTNVEPTFLVASEIPRPPVALFPSDTAGTPVIISIRNADWLNYWAAGALDATVQKFELRDAAGTLVPSHILANARLRGVGVILYPDAMLDEGVAVLTPVSPLARGATYTVIFESTLKPGAALARTWSFTTKP